MSASCPETKVFDSQREREATINLCIFPHLKEFLAIDLRSDLPGRPMVKTLVFEEVHGKEFLDRVESDFSRLLRKPDQSIVGLIGLPQEVESLVRTHSLRRVMEFLNTDLPADGDKSIGSVGVMFFAGSLLTVSDDQLSEVIKDIFGDHMTPGQVSSLYEQARGLLIREREAVSAASRSELAKLISGDEGPYVTIWDREQE